MKRARVILDSLKATFTDKDLFNAYLFAYESNTTSSKPYFYEHENNGVIGLNGFSKDNPNLAINFLYDLEYRFPQILVFNPSENNRASNERNFMPSSTQKYSVTYNGKQRHPILLKPHKAKSLFFNHYKADDISKVTNDITDDIFMYDNFLNNRIILKNEKSDRNRTFLSSAFESEAIFESYERAFLDNTIGWVSYTDLPRNADSVSGFQGVMLADFSMVLDFFMGRKERIPKFSLSRINNYQNLKKDLLNNNAYVFDNKKDEVYLFPLNEKSRYNGLINTCENKDLPESLTNIIYDLQNSLNIRF